MLGPTRQSYRDVISLVKRTGELLEGHYMSKIDPKKKVAKPIVDDTNQQLTALTEALQRERPIAKTSEDDMNKR